MIFINYLTPLQEDKQDHEMTMKLLIIVQLQLAPLNLS